MPGRARSRGRRRTKALLALLVAVGALGSITVSGTYAVMRSEETNAGSTVSAGTLTLGDTVGSGTTCLSWAAGTTGNVNGGCAPLVASSTLQYPGGTPATAEVRIDDTGSLDGSSLSVYMPACTPAASPGANANANGGNPCAEVSTNGTPSGLQLTIQETDSTWTNPKKCWYPVKATGACASAAGYATKAPNSFPLFAEYVTSASASWDLGKGPTAGASRYFLVSVLLPANASDTLQGEQATFDLTWHLTS